VQPVRLPRNSSGGTSFTFARILLLAALLSLLPSAQAQNGQSSGANPEPEIHTSLRRGANEFGVWGGYSPFSFQIKGVSEDRQLLLLNLQYARTLFSTTPITLKYTAEVVPAAFEIQPTQIYYFNNGPLVNPAGTIYAAGASPIGFQGNIGRKKIQPFANGSIGFLYFDRQVPIIGSSQFNYTISIGFGAQFMRRSGRSFSVGWKYFHLSNNYQATLNPGIDSGVFYAGFSIVRGER
jgi:Lipid A 3-O-deacylase (PagL)